MVSSFFGVTADDILILDDLRRTLFVQQAVRSSAWVEGYASGEWLFIAGCHPIEGSLCAGNPFGEFLVFPSLGVANQC